jgi:hypothetical protein
LEAIQFAMGGVEIKGIALGISSAAFSLFRQPYRISDLASDSAAGVTVGLIALPLALALGIASGPAGTSTPYPAPALGLFTAIIAGFLISALGGSRVQIGGTLIKFIPWRLPAGSLPASRSRSLQRERRICLGSTGPHRRREIFWQKLSGCLRIFLEVIWRACSSPCW